MYLSLPLRCGTYSRPNGGPQPESAEALDDVFEKNGGGVAPVWTTRPNAGSSSRTTSPNYQRGGEPARKVAANMASSTGLLLIQVLLEAAEGLADLLRMAEVGYGVRDRVVIPQP